MAQAKLYARAPAGLTSLSDLHLAGGLQDEHGHQRLAAQGYWRTLVEKRVPRNTQVPLTRSGWRSTVGH
jgi:hypothetical protein